jgi:hypothetical protein
MVTTFLGKSSRGRRYNNKMALVEIYFDDGRSVVRRVVCNGGL